MSSKTAFAMDKLCTKFDLSVQFSSLTYKPDVAYRRRAIAYLDHIILTINLPFESYGMFLVGL